jgi:hypothetical protein
MKQKGIKWNSNSEGASWDQIVANGCEHAVKRSYNFDLAGTCRSKFEAGGEGITYAKRSWCEVDDCRQKCEETTNCGQSPLAEIAVLMGKFQNKQYGKKCDDHVTVSSKALLEEIIGSILKNEYGYKKITNADLVLQNDDGDFRPDGFIISHYGTKKNDRGKFGQKKA